MKIEITNRHDLLQCYGRGDKVKFLFFWGHTSKSKSVVGPECLSQWYPSSFSVSGTTYPTAEHYMMVQKASLFGDQNAAGRILESGAPTAVKQIGRRYQGSMKTSGKRSGPIL